MTSMASRHLRVGLVGCGHISATHIAAWRGVAEATVVALCDVDAAALAKRCQETGLPGFANIESLLAGPSIDALDICIPPLARRTVMGAGVRAGKHLLVQKPFASSLE